MTALLLCQQFPHRVQRMLLVWLLAAFALFAGGHLFTGHVGAERPPVTALSAAPIDDLDVGESPSTEAAESEDVEDGVAPADFVACPPPPEPLPSEPGVVIWHRSIWRGPPTWDGEPHREPPARSGRLG